MYYESVWFWIFIVLLAFLIFAIFYGFFHKDKCPYCNSKNTSLDFIEGNHNWGIWHMHCNDCGKKFTLGDLKND